VHQQGLKFIVKLTNKSHFSVSLFMTILGKLQQRNNEFHYKPLILETECVSMFSFFFTQCFYSNFPVTAPFDRSRLYVSIRFLPHFVVEYIKNNKKIKLRGFSPQANYTDRATAACRRS
jgi:hypothetical protein